MLQKWHNLLLERLPSLLYSKEGGGDAMSKLKKYIAIFMIVLFSIHVLGFESTHAANRKLNMSYLYSHNNNYAAYSNLEDQTQNSLNEVAFNFFGINADGSLKLPSSASVQSFIDEMHRQGIQVIPYLSNDWDSALGISALQNRSMLSSQIADAIIKYDLDGVNLDIENLNRSYASDYTDFVRLLRQKLPLDKKISVAVAANPYNVTSGWVGLYDYAGLAAYCDYLMIMAYDEHYKNGGAGPVASLSFAEKSIQYALGRVSQDKIVLGVPFYGRIWKNGGGYPNGDGINNALIDQLVTNYHGVVTFDPVSKTPYATITILASDPKPMIRYNTLTEGTYTIWYENEQSIKEKLALVQKYDIRGTGSWSLGQEKKSTWDYYKLWLNGCYFTDVLNHWARDSVLVAYQNDWINGTSTTTFGPNEPLTRGQAAAMLVRMLDLPVKTDGSGSFTDTKGHWAEREIETARSYRIIQGLGNKLFSPDSPVTREQMAVMLSHVIKLPLSNTGKASPLFYDVSLAQNPWSYQAIAAMSHNGILTGYPTGSFCPARGLSRAEMAAMMERISPYL